MRIGVYSTLWGYWVPPIIWTLTIVVLSGNSGSLNNTFGVFKWVISWVVTLDYDTISLFHYWFRKVLHVMYYGVLCVLWFRALMATFPKRLGLNLILALVLCLTVALIDEGHQLLVASRRGSLGDVALDMTGAVLFTLFTARYWKRKFMLSEARPPSP